MEDYIFDGITNIRFNAGRKVSISPDYRPLYKITQILILLNYSNRRSSSLLRIQLFNYALKKIGVGDFLGEINSNQRISIVRFDPAVNRALIFAKGNGLLDVSENGKFKLTERGAEFIEWIVNEGDLLLEEKHLIQKYGRKITDSLVDRIFKGERGGRLK